MPPGTNSVTKWSLAGEWKAHSSARMKGWRCSACWRSTASSTAMLSIDRCRSIMALSTTFIA
eukprot:scaffold96391_cov41-Phaeocystis_antarctica.AAC.1